MNGEFSIIKQSEISESILDEIIILKQQHWPYSYESQKEWIMNTLEPEAVHLLLRADEKLVAYLSIRNIGIIADDKQMVGKGIGNVCVDKNFQKYGFGKKLVKKANEIINSEGYIGILLCHTHLIPFYEKCGWLEIKYDNMEIDKKAFSDVLMLFNHDISHISCMSLDRNF